jgi:SAM-dependent methyltransferase
MYKEYRRDNLNNPNGWSLILPVIKFFHIKARFDPRWRVIKNQLSSPILDAGCGHGDRVNFLTSMGYESTGLDYSKKMIDLNNLKYEKSRFIYSDLKSMPIEDSSFNSIISWGVIEHDENGPLTALNEFRRVLRKNGRILVTVPVDSIYQRKASQISFGNDPKTGVFFQYFFNADELSEFCKAAGFYVLDCGYLSRPHPALVFPNLYNLNNKILNRILQFLCIFSGREKCNMIFCLAEKI